ncbi:MAG TPA: rhomboid family intramembrane serine protease [Fermentimonas caenicola]|nr:rhomboid family intramembrane serine protease [Fermentimonas sp.]MBP6196135.1 rhomboid family intramembrane serine protease [Fermentimonas sp.]MBP7104972.1 rhomboid family intramembrane serine protease [Fermentimonas sp.]TAH60899.1 MAG: rhomboid family intramembrane serine protease [Fermentimonas caenicola]HHU41653.1 rhomboid family intramembrane serine protease [Fermentimonas caenicola]
MNAAGLFGSDFSQFGILPREIKGLRGIVFSPFIHSSVSHIASNTLPLLILIQFLFYFYSKIAFSTFAYLWFLSGILTWIIGRGYYHVGASGIVFSIMFFLFFSGVFRKSIQLIAVSLIVAFVYGSTVWSIFPIAELVDSSISWEGHLAGTLSGLVIAVALRHQGPQKIEKVWEDEEENELDEISEN